MEPDLAVAAATPRRSWWRSINCSRRSSRAQNFDGQDFVNDLERPVFEKFVFLAQLKGWLLKQAEVGAALMSGSGSTVFAVLRENADVDLLTKRAREELDREIWTCACETI